MLTVNSRKPKQARAAPVFVASRLHTAIVLIVLGVLAAGGALRALRGSHDLVGPAGRLPLYGLILAIQLVLFWFVRTGIRRSGYSVRALVDQSPWTAGRWARYAGIAVAGWLLWMIFGAVLGSFLRPSPDELRAVLQFLPHGAFEKLCWVAFSVGTNLCEEVLYRGYLMRQFSGLTGSPAMALLLQAAVFAVGHVSLGLALMISVSLLALWLGALTWWQKSLVPAMLIHAGISLFGGLAYSPP
ncbi:MAG TPA: CPBP family intramembrane glutamic endopeptidase [Pyrinomonadaceae bacterium]|nr:CPBP family intramembrane glutamic endopeptidase [Pyrinomonadaceae bacterium]